MKDPAALVYIDKWTSSTSGMKAELRAWYFDLLLYQFDKGYIPNDVDEIAGICRVRPSEYNLFRVLLKQMLKQKFSKTKEGNYENKIAKEIIKKRGIYKSKKSKSGVLGAFVRYARSKFGATDDQVEFIKKRVKVEDLTSISLREKGEMLSSLLKLYNTNVNEDINIIKKKNKVSSHLKISTKPSFEDFWDAYDKKKGDKAKIRKKWEALGQKEREAIMAYIPLYKREQPDKTYRKNPETFLNNKSWHDEIILPQEDGSVGAPRIREFPKIHIAQP